MRIASVQSYTHPTPSHPSCILHSNCESVLVCSCNFGDLSGHALLRILQPNLPWSLSWTSTGKGNAIDPFDPLDPFPFIPSCENQKVAACAACTCPAMSKQSEPKRNVEGMTTVHLAIAKAVLASEAEEILEPWLLWILVASEVFFNNNHFR